jgi:hypothetical protein
MLSPLPRRSGWAYCFAHFTQPYQPSPKGLSGRPAHRPFRGLLGVHTRYGLHTRAVTVYRDTLSEGFSHFVTSIAAPVASGWSVCRVGLSPTGKRRLFTAHTHSGHCRAERSSSEKLALIHCGIFKLTGSPVSSALTFQRSHALLASYDRAEDGKTFPIETYFPLSSPI